jgi:hypothetical protein
MKRIPTIVCFCIYIYNSRLNGVTRRRTKVPFLSVVFAAYVRLVAVNFNFFQNGAFASQQSFKARIQVVGLIFPTEQYKCGISILISAVSIHAIGNQMADFVNSVFNDRWTTA